MMKYFVGLVLIVAVVAGGYYFMNNTAMEEQLGSDIEQEENMDGTGNPAVGIQPAEGTGAGTFADLMQMGGNHECTVNMETEGITSQGTTYIAGDQLRGDYRATAAGMTINTSLIVTGGFVYTWTDLMPQGFKVPVSTTASGDVSAQGFDTSANVSYDCQAWSPDASKFVVPSTVTFTEIQAE